MSIIDLIKRREFKDAELLAIKEFNNNKKSIISSNALGFVYLVRQKIKKAIETYLNSLVLDQNDFEANNNLADLYLKIEEIEKSRIYATKAKQLNKDSPSPLIIMAQITMKEKKYNEAKNFIEEAIELLPNGIENNSYLKILYCDTMLANKQKDKCLDFISKCQNNKLDINLSLYHSTISIDSISKNEIKHAEDIKKNINLSQIGNRHVKKTEIQALYFLGNIFDKSDKKKSEKLFFEANELASKIQEFKPLTSQKYTERIMKLFSTNFKKFVSLKVEDSNGYIFIVGMPRSGTTLTESIISTFGSVFPGGEMHSMSSLCRESYLSDDYELNEKFFFDIHESYSRRVNCLKGKKLFFTDKLPNNYFHLGYIKCAFPNSKVINVKRNRWDIATSIYKQFYVDNIRYSTKFFNIAIQIANYEALMNFWSKKIDNYSDFVYEIRYEDLVSNTEEYSREIANFIGIDEEVDLSQRSNYFSETASKSQVNQNIYRRSLNKEAFGDYFELFQDSYLAQIDFWKEKYGVIV